MKQLIYIAFISVFLSTAASAKDLQFKINEKENNFVFSVKTEDIKKNSSKEVLNFFSTLIADNPLEGKDFKYQTIYSKIQLNCQDGSGEITFDLFKGKGITTDKVATSNSAQKIVKGTHSFLPKDLAYQVCTEAKVMGLVSAPGTVLQPELLPGGAQPPALELRVIQSRIYESNMKDFVDAVTEMCGNGGGTFIGFLPQAGHTGTTKYRCMSVKLEAFKKFQANGAHVEADVEPTDATHIKVRLRIEDYLGTPAYSRYVYAAVFKEISDSIGILDIPINVKTAE